MLQAIKVGDVRIVANMQFVVTIIGSTSELDEGFQHKDTAEIYATFLSRETPTALIQVEDGKETVIGIADEGEYFE